MASAGPGRRGSEAVTQTFGRQESALGFSVSESLFPGPSISPTRPTSLRFERARRAQRAAQASRQARVEVPGTRPRHA